MIHLQMNSISIDVCYHSFRYFRYNQLTGTIPSELSSLSQLVSLYAQNRIVFSFYTQGDLSVPSLIDVALVAISETSNGITSQARSHLSSAIS